MTKASLLDLLRPKKKAFLGPQAFKAEETKRAVLRELLADMKTNGAVRDYVRRVLDDLPAWTPFVDVTDNLSSPMARAMGVDDPAVLLKMQELLGVGGLTTRVFQNSRYFVHRTGTSGGGFSLSIRTLQNDARHDWREFQRIKNELCGEELEAVELYPAESRLVDTANQYYAFVLPPGVRVPLGFADRLVMKPASGKDPSGSNQRPWEQGTEPADAVDRPGPELEKLVYRRAILALTENDDHGDSQSEGDRVQVRAGGADHQPRVRRPVRPAGPDGARVDGVGGQPGQPGEEGQGDRADREDHPEAAGAVGEGGGQVRGEEGRQAVQVGQEAAEDGEEGETEGRG